MTKYKTNKVKDQVSTIVANIRTLYGQQLSYGGLNNQTAIQMDVIPEEMIVKDGNGKLVNAFNGTTFIGSGSIGASVTGVENDQKAFIIEYNGLPRAACVDLATGDWGLGSSSGLMGIKATGSIPAAATTSTPDAVTDVTEIQFQAGGVSCTGVQAVQGSVVACPGGTKVSVPLQVAQAAVACNCGTANGCTVVWKYF
jgi:hypothetical protein